MTSFEWKRPHHTRWLAACLIGLTFAVLVGGFSLGLAALFVVIFAVGAAVLSLDGLGAPQPERIESEPSDDLTPNGDQHLA